LAELPLAKRIVNPRLKSPFLFSLAYFKPQLDEQNVALHDISLHLRRKQQEPSIVA
jgi:hypothetical protein